MKSDKNEPSVEYLTRISSLNKALNMRIFHFNLNYWFEGMGVISLIFRIVGEWGDVILEDVPFYVYMWSLHSCDPKCSENATFWEREVHVQSLGP